MTLRIIAVDDEPANLELLKAMVEPLGFEVLAVGDSRDAARLIQHVKFDGAVVDVLMPYLDGFELTRCIRNSSLNHQVPIVMLTTLDDADTMRKGFNAGANFFLGKPISRERISTLFSATRGSMLKEKREHARIPFCTSVTCKWDGARRGNFKAGSIDICGGGMLIGPSGGLDVGQEIELEFDLPTGPPPLKPRAKILRKEKLDQIAVEFTSISSKDRDAIRSYIFDRVRN
jgi:CheY-like chemotaxis protein